MSDVMQCNNDKFRKVYAAHTSGFKGSVQKKSVIECSMQVEFQVQ